MKGPVMLTDVERPEPRTAYNQMASAMQVRNQGHRSCMVAPH